LEVGCKSFTEKLYGVSKHVALTGRQRALSTDGKWETASELNTRS
jgi:hypothetical protein